MSELSSCSMCGAEVSPDAKTCGSCGEFIVPPSEPPPAMPPPSPLKTHARRNLIALAVLLVSLGGLILFLRTSGSSNAAMNPQQAREARVALDLEWETRRDEYFALAARVDLVEREDMDARRIYVKADAWTQLGSDERALIVDLLALKVSARLSEPARGRLELVEGTTVVAGYEPGRGVTVH